MEKFSQNEEKKNILFVISSIGGGGAERVACRLVNEFSKKHKVYLMYFDIKEKEYPVDPKVTKIPFIADKNKIDNKTKKKINQKTQKMNKIEKIRIQNKIDITISFLFWPNIYNVDAEGGTKKILSERSDPDGKGEDYFKNMISAYEKADIVVFQTEFTKNKFPENIKKKGIIIPNPINISCFSEPLLMKKKIVSVGRLVPQKNHTLLIKAFAVFLKTHKDYNLHIYGIGNILDELKLVARENNVEEFVHFEGFCEDVHERIKDAEQFVFSSNYEGMPNALMEAMMMGLPCISTNCSGIGEIICNEIDGLLVPKEDVSSLSKAMCRLSDDKALQNKLREAARIKAEAWKTETIAEKWEELF
jgi:glycosyltransferase involved in cell wall biosynthesis